MSAALSVSETERGVVRVFALKMAADAASKLRDPGAAAHALGVAELDPAHVEVFPISDLAGMELPDYLTAGIGVPETEIAADKARLSEVTGWVLIVLSRAFGGRAARLQPTPPLQLIGVYSVAPTDWSPSKTETPRALAHSDAGAVRRRSPRAERASSRRIGATIFTIFVVILAVIVLLVAAP